ncbi:MAG: glycoside hydrolase family 20 zincin-like fold domain-containing protein [Bacilli bacterium]|nr:glycoside hydrolase family 20 zincin-like fold domain-containing protein [Bacilli bacterium]
MRNIARKLFLFVMACPVLAGCGGSKGESVSISVADGNALSAFASSQIESAVTKRNGTVKDGGDYQIDLTAIDEKLGKEAYKIEVDGKSIKVTGGDETGLMYGGLSIAEQIEFGGASSVVASSVTPSLEARGLKFNIPLDMRTPSYTDGGDSGQANIPVMWDMDFWKQELDMMALNRMNYLTLWNLNPFPSMVKVPGYEDCALNDVWRTTMYFDDSFKGTGNDLVREEMYEEGNYEVVKTITIDEKIQFWKDVFAYAHSRGIKVYYYFWNVYTFGEHGKYGITAEQDNATTTAYYRAAVETFIDTYQDLDGIGIAAGENMNTPTSSGSSSGGGVGYGDEENELWLHSTYGEAVKASLAKTPDRDFEFIHRMHFADAAGLKTIWGDLPCTFSLSDKYSTAHMYSVEEPHVIDTTLSTMEEGQRLFLEVRNDDAFFHRYGGVDFLRAYVNKMPKQATGFFMGSDGYIQGKEFIDADPDFKGQLYQAKHWMNYMLLGRIGYQKDLTDDFIKNKIKAHFSDLALTDDEAKDFFDIMNEGGKILPKSNILYYVETDVWFPEASWTNPSSYGYVGVKQMINSKSSHPYGNTLSIAEYVVATLNNETITQNTPIDIINALRDAASKVDALYAKFESRKGQNKEFDAMLLDQVAWSNFAKYLAKKYEGIIALRTYNDTRDAAKQTEAITLLTEALPYWEAYANDAIARYGDNVRLSRAGIFSFSTVTAGVKEDIEAAKNWKCRTYR